MENTEEQLNLKVALDLLALLGSGKSKCIVCKNKNNINGFDRCETCLVQMVKDDPDCMRIIKK